MILFKKLSIKNFLSYGNVPTVWELNKHNSTLIIGRNGHGKSTILDGICYSLFGKPYRNINKPQLINSINGKSCLTELELTVDGVEYKIIRGMKPNVFEIYKEGKMIDQEAAMKDMQEFLESNIIKLNYRTFCQVVILGSASFTPFMKLPTHQRREVVEDVLDIGIFSKMNQVLKDRVAATKEELRIVEVKVESAKKETKAQKRIIEVIEKNKTDRISEIEIRKSSLLEDLRLVKVEQVRLVEDKKKFISMDTESIKKEYEKVSSEKDSLDSEVSSLKTKLKKLHQMHNCPTCLQEVSDEHKHHIGDEFTQKIKEIETVVSELSAKLPTLSEKVEDIEKVERYFSVTEHNISQQEKKILESIEECDNQIKKIKEDSSDIDEERSRLKEMASEALKLVERRSELLSEKQLQEISQVLLKDNGIKTAIIREYLPVLNKLINKYLQAFDFFVNFNLDEGFNEVIKSRGRDEFSYSSFSEGEKKRLDLAILLAFRQIAAMKNSAKVNLIIFDELVDSSLDLDARAKFNELLESMQDSNVFVISHTDTNPENYCSVIKVEKKGDFSSYSYL